MQDRFDRRQFLAGSTVAGTGLAVASRLVAQSATEKPALLGGQPVRKADFPKWPVFDESEERQLVEAVRGGNWGRSGGQAIRRFEESFGRLMGARFCLATSSGTGALLSSLAAVGVEPGDEVILPPYTFIACVNVVLQRGAMPVFADVDPETFQIDPQRVQAAITERTRAIMPVHIGGSLVDMDAIREVAARRQIPIVEDACQAHLAEWRGRKAGTLGQIGCFSFQASKNLTSGEGGALVVEDEQLWERCYAFHYQGVRPRSARQPATELPAGCKFTITEFQAAVLLSQLARLENQAQRRSENAAYLTNLLQQIPGILPARMYDGCTRNAYHLYMFRYQPEAFADLPRSLFLKALSAEGIPASSGYTPLNKQPIIDSTLRSRGFRRLFPEDQIEQWVERNRCPRTDALCDQAVWFSQRLLLADRQDMDQIAVAVRKIQQHAGALKRA